METTGIDLGKRGVILLSLSKEFIFLHVNRAAGSSITQVLRPYATTPPRNRLSRFMSRYNLQRDPAKMNFPGHMTACEVRARLPKGMYDSFFTAAFVRNPYSWLVSIYNMLLQSKSHRHRKPVIAMSGFSEYIDWEIRRNKRSLYRFVCDSKGELIVDFVGRFEKLKDDYELLCERIGIDAETLGVARTARRHADYRSYYDDATREKVALHWARDIELFGYNFEGVLL